MESSCPDETLDVCRMNLNLCILCMFNDAFLLRLVHLCLKTFCLICILFTNTFLFRPFSKCSPCEMNQIMADIMISGGSNTDVQMLLEGCRLGLQYGMVIV